MNKKNYNVKNRHRTCKCSCWNIATLVYLYQCFNMNTHWSMNITCSCWNIYMFLFNVHLHEHFHGSRFFTPGALPSANHDKTYWHGCYYEQAMLVHYTDMAAIMSKQYACAKRLAQGPVTHWLSVFVVGLARSRTQAARISILHHDH